MELVQGLIVELAQEKAVESAVNGREKEMLSIHIAVEKNMLS